MKNSIKIAFCGVLAAVNVVILFLTGVVPVATIAMPALAGCFLIPAVAECGVKWGFGVYAAAGVLGLLLSADREAALIYLLFFGYYPALYALLDRIQNKAARYLVKLVIFNGAAVAEALISLYVLGIPFETVSFLGPWTPVVLLVLANVVFLIYDFALRGLIVTYFARLHASVSRVLRSR